MRTNRFFRTCAVVLSLGVFSATMTGCSQTPEETKVYTIEDTINRIKAARPNFVEEKLVPVVLYNVFDNLYSDKSIEGQKYKPRNSEYGLILLKGKGNKTINVYPIGPWLQIKSIYYPTGNYLERTDRDYGLNTFNLGNDFGYTNNNYPIIGTIKKDNQTSEYLLNPRPIHLPLNKKGYYGALSYKFIEESKPYGINSNQIVSIEGKLIRKNLIEIPLNRHHTKKYTEDLTTRHSIEYLISKDNIEEVNILKFNKKQGNNLYLTYYTYKRGGYKNENKFAIPNIKNHTFICNNDKFRLKEYYNKYGQEYIYVSPIDPKFQNYKDPIITSLPVNLFYVNYLGYINNLNLSHSPK